MACLCQLLLNMTYHQRDFRILRRLLFTITNINDFTVSQSFVLVSEQGFLGPTLPTILCAQTNIYRECIRYLTRRKMRIHSDPQQKARFSASR